MATYLTTLKYLMFYDVCRYIIKKKKSFGQDNIKVCFQNFRAERTIEIVYAQFFHFAGEEIEIREFKCLSRSHDCEDRPLLVQVHTPLQAGGKFPRACHFSVTF